MSELIKSVRIRPIEGSTDDLKIGRLDTKVSLFRDNRRTRNCIGYSISSTGDELGVNWSSIEYQTNPTRAWYQFIGPGGTPYDVEKTRGYKVRAVRSF